MLLCRIIVMKLLVGSILLGTGMAKPVENENFRQYQNSGENLYTPPLPSLGAFGASQSGFSPLSNSGVFMPQQSVPPSSLNFFGSNPFGAQSFGTSSYGSHRGFAVGIPNYFG